MRELQAKNNALNRDTISLTRKVCDQYEALSNTVFKLADKLNSISHNYRKIEEMFGENISSFVQISQVYCNVTNGVYGLAEELSKTRKNFKKHVGPLYVRLTKDHLHINQVKTSDKN